MIRRAFRCHCLERCPGAQPRKETAPQAEASHLQNMITVRTSAQLPSSCTVHCIHHWKTKTRLHILTSMEKYVTNLRQLQLSLCAGVGSAFGTSSLSWVSSPKGLKALMLCTLGMWFHDPEPPVCMSVMDLGRVPLALVVRPWPTSDVAALQFWKAGTNVASEGAASDTSGRAPSLVTERLCKTRRISLEQLVQHISAAHLTH